MIITNNTIIKNNLSEKNIRYGLHFMFSHSDTYTSNTFKNNGAGVAVMYSKHVKMENNRFEENWGPSAYGILLKDITTFILNPTLKELMVGKRQSECVVKQNSRMSGLWRLNHMMSDPQ